MTRITNTVIAILVAALAGALLTPGGAAEAAEVKVLSTVGVKAVLEELIPQFERETGIKVTVDFSSSATLKKRIDGGETFDMAIIVSDLIDDLVKQGKIAANAHENFARTGAGVAILASAPRPDISSVETFKALLVNSKSIALSDPALGGASTAYFISLVQRLGIADNINPKLRPVPPGQVTWPVATGDADLGIGQISEIVPDHRVALLGPFPADVQVYTANSAGISEQAKDLAASKSLMKFLTAPAAASVLKAKGLEPG